MTNVLEIPSGAASGAWLACGRCGTLLYRKRFDRLHGVCADCGWHSPLTAARRLDLLLDEGSGKQVDGAPTVTDPLGFADVRPYAERLAAARAATGMDDAVMVRSGEVHGHPVVMAAMDFRFLGGSLGCAAGEAVAAAAETALTQHSPLVLVTASGGARMQEGVLSLMQMSKTANALAALDEAGLLTVTVVTDPTYGGVAASFATLSDVIIAEPGARMGFAGRRVVEQTIGERLPEDFQTAEFLLAHGLVDDVRPRGELRSVLAALLAAAGRPAPARYAEPADPVWSRHELVPERPVAEVLRLARHIGRPTARDHVAAMTEGFVELRGDRAGADCPAIVGGLALLDGMPVAIIGHQKGHTTGELVRNCFGMASPAGYRKALRIMRLAGKLGIPLVTLIDTPGAHPGAEAEEGGQAHVIAECLRTLGGLPVPVIAVVTGEGGSGGALALAVADRVLICENAFYSVISPEGCASILWRDASAASRAGAALGVDARSLLRLGVVDGVVPEPEGGAHRDPARASGLVLAAVASALRTLRRRSAAELVAARRDRFRRFGLLEGSLS